jgi:hypothetical protein
MQLNIKDTHINNLILKIEPKTSMDISLNKADTGP